MLPTQDKELRLELIHWLASYDERVKASKTPLVSATINGITNILEKLGYHKGLPSSIERDAKSTFYRCRICGDDFPTLGQCYDHTFIHQGSP